MNQPIYIIHTHSLCLKGAKTSKDGWLPPTMKRRGGKEVWSPHPTGPTPCLVVSAQGAGGDSLTTCAPVCPWLTGWTHQ